MKLYAICWQDSYEPWGWAPAVGEDDHGLSGPAFFWDRDDARRALDEHLDRLVPEEMEIALRRHAVSVSEFEKFARQGGPRVTVTISGQDPPVLKRDRPPPAPTPESVRATLASEWCIQEYDVSAPGS